jgi:hypothetical protein
MLTLRQKKAIMQNKQKKRKREHIALDFDGTLSEYHGYRGPCNYGPPIPFMVAKVKYHLGLGDKFTIFSARASSIAECNGIKAWLKQHGLPEFPVTNTKLPQFTQFWDDRAVHIEKNTGMTTTESGWYSMYPEELKNYIAGSCEVSEVEGVSK